MTATTAPATVASPTRPAAAGLIVDIARSARAELLRLRKWPAVWITLAAWLALSVMFGYLFTYLAYATGDSTFAGEDATEAALLAELMPASVPDVFLQGLPMFGGALMMVLGAITAGNGYRWGTWSTVFARGSRRSGVVLGSMAALTVIVIATLVASLAVDFALSLLVAAIESQPVVLPSAGPLLVAVGAGFLVLEMWAMIGFLLGTLGRGPALAVGLGLVWALVIENLLRGVGQLLSWVESFTAVLPGTAAGSLIGSIVEVPPGGSGTPGVLETVSGGQAILTMAVYLAVTAAATVFIVARRDLT